MSQEPNPSKINSEYIDKIKHSKIKNQSKKIKKIKNKALKFTNLYRSVITFIDNDFSHSRNQSFKEALSKLLNEILMKFIGLWTIYESNTDNKEAHEIEKNILLYSIDFPQEIIKKNYSRCIIRMGKSRIFKTE